MQAPQHTGAHRRFRLIKHPEKCASLLLFPERLSKLQVPARGRIQHHKLSGRIDSQARQVFQCIFLRLIQILQDSARRDRTRLIVCQSQRFQVLYMKMFPQDSPAGIIRKEPIFKC